MQTRFGFCQPPAQGTAAPPPSSQGPPSLAGTPRLGPSQEPGPTFPALPSALAGVHLRALSHACHLVRLAAGDRGHVARGCCGHIPQPHPPLCRGPESSWPGPPPGGDGLLVVPQLARPGRPVPPVHTAGAQRHRGSEPGTGRPRAGQLGMSCPHSPRASSGGDRASSRTPARSERRRRLRPPRPQSPGTP